MIERKSKFLLDRQCYLDKGHFFEMSGALEDFSDENKIKIVLIHNVPF